jgi:transcriptional regulator with XRE-family HTH domain
MAQPPTTKADLMARFRQNVQTLKGHRGMSDTDITEAGGYSSRQLLNHRLTGRTLPDLDDLARVAAALRVEPILLLQPLSEVMAWIEENPTYKPPKMPKAVAGRDAASTRTSRLASGVRKANRRIAAG